MTPPSRWARIRARLLAAVIGLNLLLALPAPHLSERDLARPDAQDELRSWKQLSDRLGFELSRDELGELALTWSRRWIAIRRVAIDRPARPLHRYLGIRQGWALFARPETWPATLTIELKRPGSGWALVYAPHDPEHAALEPQIRFRRTRGVLDGALARHPAYDNLCRILAQRLFDAHPDATAARFKMVRHHIGRPGSLKKERSRVLHRFVIPREEAPR